MTTNIPKFDLLLVKLLSTAVMRHLSASNYKGDFTFKLIHLTSVSFTSVVSQSRQEHTSALGHREMIHYKKEERKIHFLY